MTLTFSDEPTIRNAIMKRVPKEPGIQIVELVVRKKPDCIFVGVRVEIDGGSPQSLIAMSTFELPRWFDYQHLLDEIDQICEQFKAARKEFHGRGGFAQRVINTANTLAGTGNRGLWRRYA